LSSSVVPTPIAGHASGGIVYFSAPVLSSARFSAYRPEMPVTLPTVCLASRTVLVALGATAGLPLAA